MERLTLDQARERIAANAGAGDLDPADIDWTQPDREALLVAGRMGATVNLDEQSALLAISLALLGYLAHCEYEAGRAAERDDARETIQKMFGEAE